MKSTENVWRMLVRKDTWTPSKPWTADLYWIDGGFARSFLYGFKTRKALIKEIEALGLRDKVVFD